MKIDKRWEELQTRIKDIVYLEEQKTIDIGWDAKSIRLDVYVEDGSRVFNLEMQTTSQKELSKRSRYYQGMIDLNTIEKGESYKKLKESYVIFICTFDPFGEGKAQYTFENLCLEDTGLKLQDGTKKVFFNTASYDKAGDKDIQDFLKFVNGESTDNPLVQEIENKIEEVKLNKEWRQEYMTLLMREEEIREEAEIRGAVNILRAINMSPKEIEKQIMQNYQITKEEVVLYLEEKNN